MYTNLNDDRFPNLTGEYEVFTFSAEEKESTLNYLWQLEQVLVYNLVIFLFLSLVLALQ